MCISVFIITKNEERKIEQALSSVVWADEIIVVDSESSDKTVDICKALGAHVSHRPFDNFAAQKNYALSLTRNQWAFSLDADETVSNELGQQILEIVKSDRGEDAYYFPRRNYFLNKQLCFGGQGDEQVLRLFRRDKAIYYGIVHEELKVNGTSGRLTAPLIHHSTASLGAYFKKFELYTRLDAQRTASEGRRPDIITALFKPPLIWIYNYLFRVGFLDGYAGLMYHTLSCYYRWIRNFRARDLGKRIVMKPQHTNL